MIRLTKSSFYKETETKAHLVKFVQGAKRFSMDEECSKFETAFAKKQKRKFAVFTSSGSAANLILIQSLLNLGRLKKGARVGVSALTWPTNIMPLIQLGLTPVLIDCELATLNVSPATLSKVIDSLDGLFLTNVLGFADNIDAIRKICQRRRIIFIEDNCESLGSRVRGRLLGNFGLAATFSFFVGHHLSTIEGGMVVTDDKALRDMLIITRAHGWGRNLEPAVQKKLQAQYKIDDFYAKYAFYDLAYNARPTEIAGFLGNRQINFWDEIIKKRQANFLTFKKLMDANPDFVRVGPFNMDVVSNFSMPLIAKNKALFEKYKQRFEKSGVEIRPVIAGDMARQPFYKKYARQIPDCPNACHIHKCGFYFPNNPELTSKELSVIKKLLR